MHATESARRGVLTVDGASHEVDLLDLPTVVESYKTYDDTNLVKTGDIGQVSATDEGELPRCRCLQEPHFQVSAVELHAFSGLLAAGAAGGWPVEAGPGGVRGRGDATYAECAAATLQAAAQGRPPGAGFR